MSKLTQNKTQLKDIFTGPVMKPLFVSLGLMLFQQTTGDNAIIFHTVSIANLIFASPIAPLYFPQLALVDSVTAGC